MDRKCAPLSTMVRFIIERELPLPPPLINMIGEYARTTYTELVLDKAEEKDQQLLKGCRGALEQWSEFFHADDPGEGKKWCAQRVTLPTPTMALWVACELHVCGFFKPQLLYKPVHVEGKPTFSELLEGYGANMDLSWRGKKRQGVKNCLVSICQFPLESRSPKEKTEEPVRVCFALQEELPVR